MNNISKEELFKKASLIENKIRTKFSIHEYRDTIILLLSKGYNKSTIHKYLDENDIKLSYTSLHNYLKKFPISEDEIEKIELESENLKKNEYKDILGE